jgi:hypothetical protein
MSTKRPTVPQPKVDTQKIDDWNDQYFKLDRRMARKMRFEVDQQEKRGVKGMPDVPSTPPPTGPAPYPRTKEFNENIAGIKQLPVEERAPKYNEELVTLQELGQRLLADNSVVGDAKKPIAADIKTAKEKIASELDSDKVEIKNLKIARKETVTDQLEAIRGNMGLVEKIGSDNGEVSQAIGEYTAAKTTLLKALTQDMTEANRQIADAAVKRLKVATETALAVDKDKRDRITASQQTLNTLAPNLMPNENGSFPQGSTKAIGKETDRTVLGHGPLFKPVLKALVDVEQSPVEPQLTVLEDAAKAYLADYDRRDAEGKTSGKPFKPDKITTAKATACRDAIERVRKLRVTRDIQDALTKLPKNPRTPDEEKAVNRLKAKMLVESGGSKQLGDDQSGASESFFLTDPTTNKKAFIFKPSDGEFDAGYGWKTGGGAPREVVLSSVNDVLKNSIGLDCGVSTTTLVSVDNPSLATDRNGKNSKRTGAIQNYVPSDPTLTKKLDSGKPEYDKDFINQIPPEEIEKVALLDFATLQMDRQASNLLVQPDANGQPRLTPIDAGNAMPSRKAFEASRRMFVNNAVLGGDEAKKKFSPDAMKKIDALDPDAVVAAMRKANSDMRAVDPNAATAVEDETIEMTRRSILFLKEAAKVLTKAEIADAYANLFHNVIDADAKDVDTAIKTAIAAQQAKPAKTLAVEQIPKYATVWFDLGWPADELGSMKGEDPAKLLDILTKGTQCPAAMKEIQEIINKVGIKNFEKDPNAEPSIGKRLSDVRFRRTKLENEALVADPQLEKNMKKVGAEFFTVDAKTKEKRPITNLAAKAKIANQVNAYVASGGDDELKRRGKSPSKMTFEEKYFESIGGDELVQKLIRQGLNVYDSPKVSEKIGELEQYHEFEALGGEEEYVRLGGPQNKEASMFSRLTIMKSKKAVKA